MYEPIRIAAAVEGPTDTIVIEAILSALLPDIEFELQTLQPEMSVAFEPLADNDMGAGWGGVYRWARQAVDEGSGSVSDSTALSYYDLLIVQLDADVAHKTYGSARVYDAPNDDLPCWRPCPPASATTDALRVVVLGWLNEEICPGQIVLCTPSKSIEAWVLAALCPNNNVVRQGNWECNLEPVSQLATLPKNIRFGKNIRDYRDRQDRISNEWNRVASRLSEAARFEADIMTAIGMVGGAVADSTGV